jgi:O-antigen/teichoic acid export membrane protein
MGKHSLTGPAGPEATVPPPGQPLTAPRRTGLNAIARGGALNLVGAGVSAVVGVLLVVVITRGLPRREAGVFFALTSVFLIAQVLAGLGTQTGLVYFIARMRSLRRTERVAAFQRVAFLPVVAVSLLATLVLGLCAPAIARIVGGGAHTPTAAVLVLAVLLPMSALSDSLLAATRGHATMMPTVAVEKIGRPLVQLGLVAAVVVGGGSLALLAGAWALPWVASAVLGGWLLSRLGRSLAPHRDDDSSISQTAREFWRFTGPRAISSVAQLVLQRFDIVLVTVLIGPAQAAVYTAATRFLVVGQFASVAIANAAQPRLAELLALDERASAKAVYQSATAWTVTLTWPMYLLCAIFANVVLAVFGRGYDAGQTVIVVLAAAMLFATACGMVDVMLNMAGRTYWTMANAVTAMVAMIGVDLLLIPRLGILGAAIGWAIALLLQNILPLSQLLAVLRLHPFGRATLLSAALCITCFGIVPGIGRLVWPGNVAADLATVVVGAVAFAAGCLRWRRLLDLPGLGALRPGRVRRPDAVRAELSSAGG